MKKEEKNKLSESKDNSFGVASVILGILSIVISSITGVILGFIGLIFALKQKKINKNSWSKAGMILNIIGIIIGVILFAFALYSFLKNPELLAQLQQLQNVQ